MGRIKPQALLQQSKKKKTPSRISVTTIIIFTLIVTLVVLSLYATYRQWSQRRNEHLRTNINNFEHAAIIEEPKGASRRSYAVVETSKGSITVEIYKDTSPEIVDKFIDLCQSGYFKGMFFDRVVKNSVILGGEKHRHGAAQDWILERKSQTLSPKHEAFMFGTTKANSDSKDFELFITTAPTMDLSDKLIVFGRVIEGKDVVQEIEEVETDENYEPKTPIGITDITLKQDLWMTV